MSKNSLTYSKMYLKNLLKEKEKEERPSYIAKMATYLQDKEPLIYLFIINSDFIEASDILSGIGPAGVVILDGRIKFLYDNNEIKKLSVEELYFLIIHEAFHIFKKHLEKNREMFEENSILANIATDTIINEEITRSVMYSRNSSGIQPKMIKGGFVFNDSFLKENEKIPVDHITSRRVFDWYKNRKLDKEDFLKIGNYVKIKNENSFGKIKKINSDGTYEVDKMTKQEMIDDFKNQEEKPSKNIVTKTKNELTPVIFGDAGSNTSFNENDKSDIIVVNTGGIHIIEENDNKNGPNELDLDTKVFTEKLLEQAKDLEKSFSTQKSAGCYSGNYTTLLSKILTPKVNWKKELRKNLNIFFTKDISEKEVKKSIITYPWNPKSRYGILCKHNIEQESNLSSYIIVAIDTSGSVFGNEYELSTFFTEIESLSKWLNFSKKGKVLTIQWDSKITEGLNYYNKGDWKKFVSGKRNISGGGGTIPNSVFDYFEEIFVKKGNGFFVNENGIKFIIPNHKQLPYLVFLTDGYFYKNIDEKDLKIYNKSIKNILFFTRNETDIPKNIKRIVYNYN
jgi:predicted metal-dependent peptidase